MTAIYREIEGECVKTLLGNEKKVCVIYKKYKRKKIKKRIHYLRYL